MRITDIQIERFGVWQDLALQLPDPGVSVFYGPNETGKSTLMRFIRGVLYGYRPADERSPGPDATFRRCSGSLLVEHRNVEYSLRRESHTGTRGRLTINAQDHGGTSEERLQRLLSGATEAVYENVFAIGLEELQQLATLSGEDVAKHIYALSLGPQGKRILKAIHASASESSQLLDPHAGRGQIVDLTQQLEQVDRDLESVHNATDRISQLADERVALYEEIDKLKQKQAVHDRNLRGYQFLDRVIGPWKRQRDLKQELSGLPQVTGLSEDALDQFDEIELELDETQQRREKLLTDSQSLEEQAEKTELDPILDEHVCVIRELLSRQEDVKRVEKRIQEQRADRARRDLELKQALSEAAVDLPWDRLERFDSSAATLSSLLTSGEQYRRAVYSRSRLLKRYKAAQTSTQKRSTLLQDRLKALGNVSLADARAHLRRRLDELEELATLESKRERLTETDAILRDQMRTFPTRRELPPFFNAALWVFAVAGLLVFAFGLASLQNASVQGGNTVWIAGAIYMLLGICCGGVTWTMKEHFHQFLKWDASHLRRSLEEISQEREQTERRIQRLIGPEVNQQARGLMRGAPAAEQVPLTEQDVIIKLRRQLAELDDLERLDTQVAADRSRLSQTRERLQHRQRTMASARREWTELLRRLGLTETLRVTDALHTWQQVAEIQKTWQEHQWEDAAEVREEEQAQTFHQEIARLARILPIGGKNTDSYALLAAWELRLTQIDESRRERRRMLQDARSKQREAQRLDETIDTLRARRLAFLTKAGAADREDLADRIQSIHRRKELQRLLDVAQRDLESAAKAEPDLAIVEDDLASFEPQKNARAIEKVRGEIKQLEGSLQGLHERLGRLKLEIQQIEEDQSLEALSRKRKRLAVELKSASERWAAARLAGMAIGRVRSRVERHCQPATLKLASDYLERLTLGKYVNVWAPLGGKELVIDDDAGTSFHVEHLSSGTREQLFLAVRMAMIREFSDRGLELPMVLDDLLVNFDQERTEAAVETLVDFAEGGRQILFFTCHLHLADLFERQGASPVWLPGHHVPVGQAG